jgi:hypothetical protein
MSTQDTEGPKTFISYSWSSPEHEAWVLQLATELAESGVDVILDKWDLREGADKYAFMEKMVTDPDIRKVVVICDRIYAEKADGRKGGVGTETQIISKEIYDQVNPTDQEQKFVAVITEKDEQEKPYVPTFLKSRIYIDMSDTYLRTQSFDQLLRWIYDRPLYKRPARGKPPAHIFTEDGVNLGTSSRFRLAIEVLRQGRASALGVVRDYFLTFAENLETLRIEPEDGKEFDEQVIESIEAFLPYRDEIIDLIIAIARFRPDAEMYEAIHSFFEQLLPYRLTPEGRSTREDPSVDNFKFILNELFLYAVAALLKHGRFDAVNQLTEQGYYLPSGSPERPEGGLIGYTHFRGYLESLNRRNKRLNNVQFHSLMAELLRDRAKRSDLNFEAIMQADFVLFLRDELHASDDLNSGMSWFPYTLVFALHRYQPFELFIRAESMKYFEQMKTALGISSKDEIARLIQAFAERKRDLPQFGMFDRLHPERLIRLERIAIRP